MWFGLTDKGISRILALEYGKRNASGVNSLIAQFRKAGLLKKNENGRNSKELEEMLLGREVLISKGKTDKEICAILALDMKIPSKTVENTIKGAVQMGGIRENPNEGKG